MADVTNLRSPAEAGLSKLFETARQSFASDATIAREEAFRFFEATGLPSRRVEALFTKRRAERGVHVLPERLWARAAQVLRRGECVALMVDRPGEAHGRRAAASRSAGDTAGSVACRRSSATSPPSDSGRDGRPSWCSIVTPSSSRKREGCSPSSSGDRTAVTTSRRRARVHAT